MSKSLFYLSSEIRIWYKIGKMRVPFSYTLFTENNIYNIFKVLKFPGGCTITVFNKKVKFGKLKKEEE